MIAQVELALQARLQAQVPTLTEVRSYQGENIESALDELLLRMPACLIVFSGGQWRRLSVRAWRRTATFQLLVVVENHRGDQERRHGVGAELGSYGLIEAIETALIGHQLGLEIEALSPVDTQNLWTGEMGGAGYSVWGLEFMTSWEVCTVDDEADDLTSVQGDFTLDGDDDGPTGQSVVDLSGD